MGSRNTVLLARGPRTPYGIITRIWVYYIPPLSLGLAALALAALALDALGLGAVGMAALGKVATGVTLIGLSTRDRAASCLLAFDWAAPSFVARPLTSVGSTVSGLLVLESAGPSSVAEGPGVPD